MIILWVPNYLQRDVGNSAPTIGGPAVIAVRVASGASGIRGVCQPPPARSRGPRRGAAFHDRDRLTAGASGQPVAIMVLVIAAARPDHR
jgi:hypothetical protein